MKKPSVTIKHRESYIFGTFLLVFSLIALIPNISAPPEEKVYGWLLVGGLFVLGLIVLGLGESMEIIDENGIYMKGISKERLIPWTDIIDLGVARVRVKGRNARYYPEIYITVRGGTPRYTAGELWSVRNLTTGYRFPYTRKIWDCIGFYYGAADFDEWGKPPEIT